MEARYLRVKGWGKKQHYDPLKRRPPWLKLYNTILEPGDEFMELSEAEQWQLVRIWLVASRAALLVYDEEGRLVPVIVDDEKSLRRSTMSLRPLPLAKFIRAGWLIPVDASELASPRASTDASSRASALLKKTENLEKIPRAVTEARPEQPTFKIPKPRENAA